MWKALLSEAANDLDAGINFGWRAAVRTRQRFVLRDDHRSRRGVAEVMHAKPALLPRPALDWRRSSPPTPPRALTHRCRRWCFLAPCMVGSRTRTSYIRIIIILNRPSLLVEKPIAA